MSGVTVNVRGDTVSFGELLLVVDIDLGECDGIGSGELSSERVIGRCDGFAWSAPVGIDYSDTTDVSDSSAALRSKTGSAG